jgi:hypothetical protein
MPKEPKRKRRKPSKRELRRRALKGWETRRLRLISREQKLLKNAAQFEGLKPEKPEKPKPGITSRKLRAMLAVERETREEAEATIAEMLAVWKEEERIEAAQLHIKEITVGWPPTRAGHPEWLRKDETLAMHPSRLRWIDDAEKLMTRLRAAEERGEFDLIDTADRIALQYDVPIQEVYTLHFSP